ncbi:Alpha-L-rhamnosidase like protein [Verticillium longisporum]|uniref:Alpha-L-rhamnosidase like protein n=1 Tax=Verticillium longisporum TaxID=100787 RepID=A0A8I2Z3A7_VERLO|nr:Alpha-L-rhamnosidase like protein [Verticillium longisporum]
MAPPTLTAPQFEHHHNGLGVESATPRISWRFETSSSTTPGWIQAGYDIEVTFASAPETPNVFSTRSDQSVLVPWPARPLASREQATVRVRVTGKSINGDVPLDNEPGVWSAVSTVEAALLEVDDFRANFVTSAERTGPHGPLQPIRLRKTFALPETITSGESIQARLYVTALGVFNVWVNGKPASNECLAPGWTSYHHRLAYRILDVSSLLHRDQANIIVAEVAEGWYAGRLGFGGGERFRYGEELALAAQLEVRSGLAGTSESWTLVTDNSWTAAASAITSSEIYDGEVYDLQNETDGWNEAGATWPGESGTKTIAKPSTRLVAPDAGPVRVTEQIACQSVFKSKSGKTILDFGQNLVGKLRIPKLNIGHGQTLTLRHAEVMEDGELGVRPLRIAKATDIVYGATGKTLQNWTPSYTFHGFRYVQVEGWPEGDPSVQDIHAMVIHTDMKRRGFFECSNSAVNQLHSNVVWSMRGNFVSIPTDCPQRDERLGWTGDLQAFAPTATFLYDTLGMLGSWIEDVSAEQLTPEANGIVPLVVPEAMPSNWPREANSQAIWGDVAVLAPQALYQHSADQNLLERQFESMKAWLDRGVERAPDGLWNPDKFQLADWLDPNAPPDDPAKASTDSVLVANAFLVHVTDTFASLCSALGKDALASEYTEAAAKLRHQFQRRYITPDGNLVSLSQTGVALAVQFGLYPAEDGPRAQAALTLDQLVRKARFHISTGFAGTPVIAHALTSIGRPQLAYRMLLETGCPSWMYPVTQGATTIWERWDSMLPDGRINPGEMTSFNHYALGAVADWLHGSVAGISPLTPGWKTVRVRPVPGGNLTRASASFDGPYGLVSIAWTLERGEAFRMELTVPPSCSAVVTLPSELRGDYRVAEEASRVVNSGVHVFECICNLGAWPPKPLVHPFMMPPEESPIAGE